MGAWVAKVFESGVINTGAELFAGGAIRPVKSFGGGISPTLEGRWLSGFKAWLGNRLSSVFILGIGRRGESVCSKGVLAGLL